MPNRRWTDNSQLKTTDNTPRPATGPSSTPTPMFGGADDPPYNADIGPGGPDLNRGANFPHVRVYMKSKQSPMIGGAGVASPMQGDPSSAAGNQVSPIGSVTPSDGSAGPLAPMPRRQGLL